MFCPKCGKELKDDALFCSGCGNALNSAAGAAGNSAGGAAAKKKISPKGLVILIAMVIVFFVILIVFFSVMRGMRKGGGTSDDASLPINTEKPFAGFEGGLNVGDKVVFGRYEQDCNTGNGAEPLEWDVIGKNGDRYMLITHYVIDYKQYDNGTADIGVNAGGSAKDAIVTWEKCSLRKWLNSDFYDTAFTDEERRYIKTVKNQNPDWKNFDDGYMGASGIKVGGYGGNMTDDDVFLLSVPELCVYFAPVIEDFNWNYFPKALASATPYAESLTEQGACCGLDELFGDEEVRGQSGSRWNRLSCNTYVDRDYIERETFLACFTRSPGCWQDSSGAFILKAGGSAGAACSKKEYCGIRPVVWVTAE